MRKLLVALVVVGGLAVLWNLSSNAADEKGTSIKDVMKTAMKGGLCKTVASGKASDEEKKKLVALFEDLAKGKPPKGSEESWKKLTSALIDAAKDCAAGKDGAGAALGKAANCMGCHKEHKG